MKRLVCVCLSLLLLAGCKSEPMDIQTSLKNELDLAISMPAGHANFNHGYYSYYLEPSIGRLSSEATSNVFMLNGTIFVMNLNVPEIVNGAKKELDPYAGDILSNSKEIAHEEGKFWDYDSKLHPYEVAIYENGKNYYTIFKTDYLQFYSVSSEQEAPQLARTMLSISRSCIVDTKEVMAKFSDESTISFNRKKLQLFQNIAPEKGAVDELFDNKSNYAGNSTGKYDGDNYATDDYGGSVDDADKTGDQYQGNIEETFENKGN